MGFSEAIKVIQFNLLRGSGVNVSPEQLGLKTDAYGGIENKFSSILSQSSEGNGLQGLKPPTPPTPPTDSTDSAQQASYQEALVKYQHDFQVYNQRYMQMMMVQFQQQLYRIQQTMQAQASSQRESADTSTIGTGGII